MVSDVKVAKVFDSLFFNTLPKDAVLSLGKCSQMDFFSRDKWYLAGGTALALQSGHRKSYDLDFFSEHPFDGEKIFFAV